MVNQTNNPDTAKRKLLGLSAASVLAPIWVKPVINAVLLPAHAQTSICMVDATVGGPLAGNASGATNCADACVAEAADQSAQLCSVNETITASGIDCVCELDLP